VGIGTFRRYQDSLLVIKEPETEVVPTPETISQIMEEAIKEVSAMSSIEVEEALKEEKKVRPVTKKVKEEEVKE
jgi:hypothetical protein